MNFPFSLPDGVWGAAEDGEGKGKTDGVSVRRC